jgi:hypothetical protein
MEITGTDKGLPVYYCENCELRRRGSPVKEYYRKDGRLFERAYILRYSYKEGNTLLQTPAGSALEGSSTSAKPKIFPPSANHGLITTRYTGGPGDQYVL